MLRFFLFLLCLSPCLLAQSAESGKSGGLGNSCKPKDSTIAGCVTDEDCGQRNTLCYMNKCRCRPGFFFSATYYTCNPTCSTSDLDSTFMEYPDSGIKGNNLQVRHGICLEDCKNLCLSTKHCLTFDFRAVGGRCVLHDVTSREFHSGWYPKTGKGWNHYQRTCRTNFTSDPVWYNTSCVNNLDCTDPYSQCLSGRCLCPFATLLNGTEIRCGVPESCRDWQTTRGKSGVYSIQLAENRGQLSVWCDMNSGDGGWLVFQRRRDGSVDFYRNWREYENGFGDVTGEFWLGLSKLHTLTKGRQTRLRVDLREKNGESHYAEYSSFSVGGPETNYRLTVSGYSGNAGDSMELHNSQNFSTFDQDNDKASANCAAHWHGAWWYNACQHSNLNGRYKANGTEGLDGIRWYHAHVDSRSFTFSEMKLKPT